MKDKKVFLLIFMSLATCIQNANFNTSLDTKNYFKYQQQNQNKNDVTTVSTSPLRPYLIQQIPVTKLTSDTNIPYQTKIQINQPIIEQQSNDNSIDQYQSQQISNSQAQISIIQQNQQILALQKDVSDTQIAFKDYQERILSFKEVNAELFGEIVQIQKDNMNIEVKNQEYKQQFANDSNLLDALRTTVKQLSDQVKLLSEQVQVSQRQKSDTETSVKQLIEILDEEQIVDLFKESQRIPHNQQNKFIRKEVADKIKRAGLYEDSRFFVKGLSHGYDKAATVRRPTCKQCGSYFCQHNACLKQPDKDQRVANVMKTLKNEQLEMQDNVNFLLKRAHDNPRLLMEGAEEIREVMGQIQVRKQQVKQLSEVGDKTKSKVNSGKRKRQK